MVMINQHPIDKDQVLFHASRIKLKIARLIVDIEHGRTDEVREDMGAIHESEENLYKAVFGTKESREVKKKDGNDVEYGWSKDGKRINK